MAIFEQLQQGLLAGKNPIPLGQFLGFRPVEITRGMSIIEMETQPHHFNPMGTLHGGICFTIADTAMGIAHYSTLEDGETSTSLEIKINFVRPVFADTLRAHGRAVKLGRTISMMECDVFDRENRLVARTSGTFMTLRAEQAQGR